MASPKFNRSQANMQEHEDYHGQRDVICCFTISVFLLLTLFQSSILVHNANADKWRLSGPNGGTVTNAIIHPDDPNTVYAITSAPLSGVLRTTDGGQSWENLNHGLELDVSAAYGETDAFTIDQENPNIMFMGWRNADYQALYRSTDGGENWNPVLEGERPTALAARGGTVIASLDTSGLWRSGDSGLSWEHIDPHVIQRCNGILFDPEDPDIIYAGIFGDGMLRSTDGGLSFHGFGFPGEFVTSFDVAVVDSTRMICISLLDEDSVLYISIDDGKSWEARCNGLPRRQYDFDSSYYAPYAVLISKNDLDIIYGGTAKGLYKTTDRGRNWYPSNNGLIEKSAFSGDRPVTILKLMSDERHENVMYAACDNGSGLFKSTDAGASWSLVGVPGMAVLSLTASSVNHNIVFAGTEHGLFVKSGDRWQKTTLFGGWGGYTTSVGLSPVDTNVVLACYTNATGIVTVFVSTDGGTTWHATVGSMDGYISSIVFDPLEPWRVYVTSFSSCGILWTSEDHGDNWSSMLACVEAMDLVIDPTNNDILYLLENGGVVRKSEDRGATWTMNREDTNTVHYALAIDTGHPEILYLATHGVYRTTDGGVSWEKTSLSEWVSDLVVDEDDGTVYAATFEKGVYRTTDHGETWTPYNEGLRNMNIRAIAIGESGLKTVVYAGTYGTGVFERESETTNVDNHRNDVILPACFDLSQNYPNPFNLHTTISYAIPVQSGELRVKDGEGTLDSEPSTLNVTLKVYNILGQEVRTLVDKMKESGYYSVKFDSENLPNGIYFYVLDAGEFRETRRMVLIR